MITMDEARQLMADYAARIEGERFLHGETVDEFLGRVATVKRTYRKRPIPRQGVVPQLKPVELSVAPVRLKKVQKKVDSSKYVFTEKQLEIAMKVAEKNARK